MLVFDPHLDIGEMMTETFRAAGHSATHSTTTDAAFDVLLARPIDACLVDLATGAGLELIGRVYAEIVTRRPAFVGLADGGVGRSERKLAREMCDVLIAKFPFSDALILDAVRAAVSGRL